MSFKNHVEIKAAACASDNIEEVIVEHIHTNAPRDSEDAKKHFEFLLDNSMAIGTLLGDSITKMAVMTNDPDAGHMVLDVIEEGYCKAMDHLDEIVGDMKAKEFIKEV
jgi:hypothetical protein